MDGDDKVEAGEDGRETVDKNADDCGSDGGIRIDAAERRVEGPAGVQTAGAEGIQHEAAADDVNVPAEKVDLRKCQVLRADHQGNQEIAEDGGNGGNEEKENHGYAVHGEKLVVGFRRNQCAGGRQKMDSNHGGEDSADEKENGHGTEIQQGDALVVGGEQPRTDAVGGIEVVLMRHFVTRQRIWRYVAHGLFIPRGRCNAGALGGNR